MPMDPSRAQQITIEPIRSHELPVDLSRSQIIPVHSSSEIDYLVSLLGKLAWPEEVQNETLELPLYRFAAAGYCQKRYMKRWTLPLLRFSAAGHVQKRYTKLVDVITMNNADLLNAVMTNLPARDGTSIMFFGSGTWSEEVHRSIGRYLYCVCRRRGGQRETIFSDRRPVDYCSTRIYI